MATNSPHISISITAEPLRVAEGYEFVSLPECGGIALFAGTVRNHTRGYAVQYLSYEAYTPMAIREMQKIAEACASLWPVHRIYVRHRTGVLYPPEPAVIIAVSTAHRQAAFEACQYIIDEIKKTVPIWKKEFLEDGEVWVSDRG